MTSSPRPRAREAEAEVVEDRSVEVVVVEEVAEPDVEGDSEAAVEAQVKSTLVRNFGTILIGTILGKSTIIVGKILES